MNLDRVRGIIRTYIGIKHSFIYKGSRNQKEEFDGYITECYPYIFIIKTTEGVIKSFSYNDFIIKSIRILP